MKKLLILSAYLSLFACNYFNGSSVVGEYDGRVYDNVFKLKLTDTKEYVFYNYALGLHTGTYNVDNGSVYLNEGNGMVDTLRIINKNTLQLFHIKPNTLNLYRIGSDEEIKHFSDSVPAVKTQSSPSIKQSSKPPPELINQLKVTPPVVTKQDYDSLGKGEKWNKRKGVKHLDTVVSDTGGE